MFGKEFNRKKGNYGEDLAVQMLLKKGYKIVERNFGAKTGEIDIIAMKNNYTVFVEVKYRSDLKNGNPAEAVDYRKQQKILNTAKTYIIQNSLFNNDFRFDVIEIIAGEPPLGRHIENAFGE